MQSCRQCCTNIHLHNHLNTHTAIPTHTPTHKLAKHKAGAEGLSCSNSSVLRCVPACSCQAKTASSLGVCAFVGCIGVCVCVCVHACDLSRPVTLIGMAHWAHFPATTRSCPVVSSFSPYCCLCQVISVNLFWPIRKLGRINRRRKTTVKSSVKFMACRISFAYLSLMLLIKLILRSHLNFASHHVNLRQLRCC